MAYSLVAGVDEVGRGCIAGPVVAAAVILNPDCEISGLTDSKKLTAKRRAYLAGQIKAKALCWSVGRAEASEIDRINILQASLLAMARALSGLDITPEWVMVDGSYYPPVLMPGETVIKGDLLIPCISAASILAKVARDNEMSFIHGIYPGYHFDSHKGYPTKKHLEHIQTLGLLPVHRRSFAPVKQVLAIS
ncbi:MAG: ribonuclease HII [Methylicorpusculum sp.]|uniref:ribonuclease HII n=1 Tax=Methylicorpusculum sp. TaxID=2713644 RepID=UPI0027196BC8|nr:ribonuclease HII [Methylicorpusculum sp.]MDO8940750.1 ribonuclease HII [Methylicorpusculum sp.]MDO9241633.1 ribonuclease HII [Methylicorpusculum sp.]MDP2204084.1 ribonuclease HII [Methylicorpusculum sp.]